MSNTIPTLVLDGVTANGDSDEYNVADIAKESGQKSYQGEVHFTAHGTWDGATATLMYSLNGGTTYVECGPDTTLTADGGGWALLPLSAKVKITVSGVGASTDLDGYL